MDATDTCASVARALGEPLAGTAPVALGWMAIEVPGAWGRDGLTDAALDPALAGAIAEAAAGTAVRLQLIRRPRDRHRGSTARRTVALAHSGPEPWCELLEVGDDELATIDPAVCASPTPPGLGRPHDDPLLLVCTHAKRDRCCATLGRPVADTLSVLHPDLVWETSHTGGHRFAANLVVLPDGLVYGGLDVASAVEAVAHHGAGRIDVAHLRGRSSLDRPAQAAEALVRSRLGLVDGTVTVVEVVHADDGTARARIITPAGDHHLAALAKTATGTPRRLSCDAHELEDPSAYRLVDLTPITLT